MVDLQTLSLLLSINETQMVQDLVSTVDVVTTSLAVYE